MLIQHQADGVDLVHAAGRLTKKPITFEGLVNVLGELRRYWLQLVELPAPRGEP